MATNTNTGGSVDMLLGKSVSWIDQIFTFATRYSDLLIYGVIAMMFAKLMRLNIKVGK